MKEIILFFIVLAVLIAGFYKGFYKAIVHSPQCIEGTVAIWTSFNWRCVDGNWVEEQKSEIEKAIMAKERQKQNEAKIKEREVFCGKGNASKDIYDTDSCIDYTLVPDENLKE